MGVLDQLGAGGRAGREVQHQRFVGVGLPVRLEALRLLVGAAVRMPALDLVADGEPGVVTGHLVELGGVRVPHDHMPDPAAVHPVAQVDGAEERRGGDDDGAQLHRGEGRLPQLDLVAEHDEDPVPGAYPLGTQPVRRLVGAGGHPGEGRLGALTVLLHDVQSRGRCSRR